MPIVPEQDDAFARGAQRHLLMFRRIHNLLGTCRTRSSSVFIETFPSFTSSRKGKTKSSGGVKLVFTFRPASIDCRTASFMSVATPCLLYRYSTAALSETTYPRNPNSFLNR